MGGSKRGKSTIFDSNLVGVKILGKLLLDAPTNNFTLQTSPLPSLFIATMLPISPWLCSASFFKRTISISTSQFLVGISHFVLDWRLNNTSFLHLFQNSLHGNILNSPPIFSAILIWRCKNSWWWHYNVRVIGLCGIRLVTSWLSLLMEENWHLLPSQPAGSAMTHLLDFLHGLSLRNWGSFDHSEFVIPKLLPCY